MISTLLGCYIDKNKHKSVLKILEGRSLTHKYSPLPITIRCNALLLFSNSINHIPNIVPIHLSVVRFFLDIIRWPLLFFHTWRNLFFLFFSFNVRSYWSLFSFSFSNFSFLVCHAAHSNEMIMAIIHIWKLIFCMPEKPCENIHGPLIEKQHCVCVFVCRQQKNERTNDMIMRKLRSNLYFTTYWVLNLFSFALSTIPSTFAAWCNVLRETKQKFAIWSFVFQFNKKNILSAFIILAAFAPIIDVSRLNLVFIVTFCIKKLL